MQSNLVASLGRIFALTIKVSLLCIETLGMGDNQVVPIVI